MIRSILAPAALAAVLAAPLAAGATATAVVQQADGTVKTYDDVNVRLARQELALTTNDGRGTVVIGKSACTKVGELVKCLPYDATLFQGGAVVRVVLEAGTVWLNPTTSKQSLPFSSAQVPPHGVILTIRTKRQTIISLSGTIDEVQK